MSADEKVKYIKLVDELRGGRSKKNHSFYASCMVMTSNMDFCVCLTIINILCSSQFVLYHIFSRV